MSGTGSPGSYDAAAAPAPARGSPSATAAASAPPDRRAARAARAARTRAPRRRRRRSPRSARPRRRARRRRARAPAKSGLTRSVPETRPGIVALLVHADRPVHAVVDDEDDDRGVVLHGGRELLAGHQEVAVARDRDDDPLRDGAASPRPRPGRRSPSRRSSARAGSRYCAELVEAVRPDREVAGAVREDRVGRQPRRARSPSPRPCRASPGSGRGAGCRGSPRARLGRAAPSRSRSSGGSAASATANVSGEADDRRGSAA